MTNKHSATIHPVPESDVGGVSQAGEPQKRYDEFHTEVARRFGLLPNFFRLVPENPEITANLWGFARFAYLDNPLPSLFKERLFVYLSRFCKVRYCITRHVGFLVGLGHPSGDAQSPVQTVEEIIRLIRRPFPRAEQLAPHLAQCAACNAPLSELPGSDSTLEESVFACATHVFLQTPNAPDCLDVLRRVLGEPRLQYLLVFFGFVRMAHYWTQVHHDLTLEDDLKQLLAVHLTLAEYLLNDPEAGACEFSQMMMEELTTLRNAEKRHDELTRVNQALRDAHTELVQRVTELQQAKGARRAALNLMEDAVRNRQETERLNAALRESEEKFRTLVTIITDIPWVTDATGAFVTHQPIWAAYTGQSWEELRGFGWTHSLHPDDRNVVSAIWERACAARSLYESHGRVWHAATQQYRYFIARAMPLLNADGNVREWIGTYTDVHDIKIQDEALHQLNNELEQRVADRTAELMQSENRLRTLATELNLAEQRERTRLATELHDYLAQLLVLGRMTLVRAKRTGLSPSIEGFVKDAEETLDKALIYCRTLMAELSPPVLQEHGLSAGLTWLGEHMKRQDLAVTIEVDEAGNVPLPPDRAVLLFQSVRELLINVAKHGAVKNATVCMTHEDGLLRIVVSDENGFDLTTTADNTSPLSSKFGLFSIRERMKALGGNFDIRSAPGQGTTATLVLPLAPKDIRGKEFGVRGEEIPDGKRIQTNGHATAVQSKYSSPIRVLLVDDHTLLRQGLLSIVSAYNHFEVVGEAGDGVEAVALAHRLCPDVIVMDINMPRMDGIEATKRIKANRPEVIIIGLSVNQSADMAQRMKAAGVTVYLTKESAADTLCRAIEAEVIQKRNSSDLLPT